MCMMRFREGDGCGVSETCVTSIIQNVPIAAKVDRFARVGDGTLGNGPTTEVVHKIHGDEVVVLVGDAEGNLLSGRV